MRLNVLSAIAGAALLPAIAAAQWSDNFDSYAPGSINGLTTGGPNAVGTWQGWDNVPAAAGVVSTAQFLSGPNSQKINGTSDSVHRYTGVTTGAWSYSISQFIPTAFTGTTYFILNNQYNDNGPYQWAVEMSFVGTSGLVIDDIRAGSNPVSFVRGQWATVRVDFDLTANTISQFYNGNLVKSGTFLTGTYTALSLQAVDLYGGTGTDVFYDNASLVPGPASAMLLGLAGLIAGRRRRA